MRISAVVAASEKVTQKKKGSKKQKKQKKSKKEKRRIGRTRWTNQGAIPN